MGFQLSNQSEQNKQQDVTLAGGGFDLSSGGGFSLSKTSRPSVDWSQYDNLTPEEIINNKQLMGIIRSGMETRFGTGNRNKYSLDYKYDSELSDEELFEKWQNYQRSFAGGQTVTSANEIAWLSSASEEQKAKVGQMYQLFDKMPNFWEKEMGWQDRYDAFRDYAKAAIWDPTTIIGLGIGRAWTQAGAKGAGVAVREVTKRSALKWAANAAKSPLAKAAAFDGAVSFATDAAYQAAMIDTNVQSEYSKLQGSISVLGAVVVPGILAGSKGIKALSKKHGGSYARVDELLKGQTSPEAVTDAMVKVLKESGEEVEDIGDGLSKVLDDFVSNSRKYADTWDEALKAGDDAFKGSTVGADVSDFYRAVLLGDGGETRGLAHMFHDMGFRYVERFEGDNFANFMGDLIMRVDDYSPGSRAKLNKSFETVFDKLPEMKRWKGDLEVSFGRSMDNTEAFARLYKQRGSAIARDLWTYKHGKDILGKAFDDASVKDMFDVVFGEDVLRTTRGHALDKISWSQTIYKRLLTAHPGTTGLNLKGWAVTHGLNKVSDTVDGVLNGAGYLYATAIGDTELAARQWNRARGSVLGSMKEGYKLFDWVDNLEAAEAYFKIRPDAQKKLSRYIAGGVESPEEAIRAMGLDPNSKIVSTIDAGATIAQKLSFVQMQDEITKNFSFIMELDRQIMREFGMSFNDFFSQENAYAKMLTKKYALAESRALERAVRETYSKSFSTGGTPGSLVRRIGQGIESVSRAPGTGFMLPFGQFMNNTFAFMGDYTGINATRHWVGRAMGQSIDLTEEDGVELLAKGAVGLGALVMYSKEYGMEKLEKGLAWNQQEREDGSIEDVTYEFPESLYRLYGQAGAHLRKDGTVPRDLVEQMIAISYGQSFRQLDDAAKNIHNLLTEGMSGNVDVSMKQAFDIMAGMTSRIVSGATRFAEPYNDAIIMAREIGSELAGDGEYDYNVVDRRQGIKWYNDATRYIDQIAPDLGGELPERESSTGEDPMKDYGRTLMGARSSIETSPFEAMLHSVGSTGWKVIRWDGPPEVKNRLDSIISPIVNYKAQQVFQETKFFDLPLKQRQRLVKTIVTEAKKETKEQLEAGFGANDDAMIRIKKISGHSKADISWAMETMGIEGGLEDLIGDPDGIIKLDLILDVLDNPENYE